MRGLYFTDPQLTAKTPSGRTDNFPVAAYKKFYEIGLIIKRDNVEAVFCGGDLFNTPRISLKYAGEIAKLIKSWGVPVYVVPGNHDIYGYNIDTIDQTILGMYEKTGVVELLTRDNPVTFDVEGVIDNYTVSFEGQEYYDGIDGKDVQQDYDVRNKSADFKALIIHSMLLDHKFHENVNHTLISDAANYSSADLIFGSHYHPGFATQTINGVTFINPGSLLRMERSVHNQTAMPKVIVFDIAEGKNGLEFNHKEVQLTVAQPGTQVFDFNSKNQAQQNQQLMQTFKKTLQNTTVLTNITSIPDMIKAIATAANTDAKILNGALAFVNNVNIMGDEDVPEVVGYEEKGQRIWIDEVRIRNFQSHKNTIVKFTKGLNVIVGESNQGKTAILRAIEWCLYNSPGGSDFIRAGENACTVEVVFSDGSIITRERTKSSAGSYEVDALNPNTNQMEHKLFKGFTNAVPVDIANIHQMPKVYLAKDLQVNLNVSSQLDGPFLLQESGANKAAAIGRLIGVESIDSAIKEVSKQLKQAQRDVKVYTEIKDKNIEELKKFDDLKDMEQAITAIEYLMTSAGTIEKELSDYMELDKDYDSCKGYIEDIIIELENMPDIDIHLPVIEKAIKLMHELRFLKEVLEKYILAVNSSYSGNTVLNWIPKSETYDPLILEAEIMMKDINKVNDIRKERISIFREIKVQEDILADYIDVDRWDKCNQIVADKIKELKELIVLSSELDALNESIELEKSNYSEYDRRCTVSEQEILAAEEVMTKYLTEVGVCPTCGGHLDSEHMNHIIGRK